MVREDGKPMYDYIEKATQHLTLDELSKFALVFSKRKKSNKKAFICWLFGGAFGLHRVYTGNYGTALGLFAITVFTLGLGAIAGIYDFVNIRRLVDNANKQTALEVVKEVKYRNGEWK